MHANARRTRLVTHERDVATVAVEVGYVLVDELHGHALVVQAEVARRAFAFSAQKTFV